MPAKNHIHRAVLVAWFAVAACVLIPTGRAQAQSPDEHASHHPGAAPAAGAMSGDAPSMSADGMPAPAGAPGMAGMAPPAGVGPPAGAGGMMDKMGEMMKNMGKPPPKEMYPSLMALPELTPDKRLLVEQQSSERIFAGTGLMGQALDALIIGAQSDNYEAIHEATRQLREGIAQFESGIAARRALAEGRAPREVALEWFKQELRLASPVMSEESHGIRGLSPFHLFTMALLIVFAFAMLAIYFFKMRRAAALFGRVEPDKGSPPPGSSPPLDGAPGPSGPTGGKAAPAGGSPPSAAKSDADSPPPAAKPDADASPPAEKSDADSSSPPAADKTPTPEPNEKPSPSTSADKVPNPPEPPAGMPAAPVQPLNMFQRVLLVDPATGFYRTKKYGFDRYFGPVDLGMHLTEEYRSLNFGVGIFAGSIFPGSNRMVVTGFSPCWQGYYISSMGGAGLVFNNLGINMLSLVGKASVPSVLYLNRNHGEEIEVEVVPIDAETIWKTGRGGVYSLTDVVYEMFRGRYENDPRILAAGPAALHSDMGGIMSVPISEGEISYVDTWAGRGGFGSAMVQNHGIVAIIYGGTAVHEDFRDKKVADEWFQNKYNLRLVEKDKEATSKYRYDEELNTGGTFGVNYTTVGGRVLAFNYRTIYQTEEERTSLHQDLVLDHYLKQFNEETISAKQQATCGEPCMAVCKKMNGIYKKDYEPYQTMGPLCGIFDQRAAEKLNHHCDTMGLDAISGGGVLAWLMDLLDGKLLTREELGVTRLPHWNTADFDIVNDSMHNAELGCELIDAILERRGILDLREGVRNWSQIHSRAKGTTLHDRLVYIAFSRRGWMVPNQYWVSGVLVPMSIMGKYYMIYSYDFIPPRVLGRMCAERMKKELILDNLGVCRFHREWAEELLPEVMGSLYNCKEQFLRSIDVLASRLHSHNSPVFWESERNIDFLHTFLKRKKEIDNDGHPELLVWLDKFDRDRVKAAREFWDETLKGIDESLVEPDKVSPPLGLSPPLDGAAGPSGPTGGKAPPDGESTPPAAKSDADSSSLPAADKAPTPEPGEKPAASAAPDKVPNPPEPPAGKPAAQPQTPEVSSAPASTASPAAPLTAKWRDKLRVENIVSETPLVKTYRLRSSGDRPLPFTFLPGQFLNVAFGVGGARMNRSYSISSSTNERDYVELTVKRAERGAVSRHIHDLIKVGKEIEAGGPVGKFTFTGTEADSVVLISAGVGITPLLSIVRYLSERSWPGDIFFIYACRTQADFIFEKAIAELERHNPKLHVVVTMSNPGADWKGPRGHISKELLTQTVPDIASRRIHLCGPPAMMEGTKTLLTELGVSPEHLKIESFGALKPTLGAPGTTAKPTATATGPLVTFSKNNKSAKIHTDQTILELSEDLGIGIENSCRVGTCGVCKVKKTSGEVEMAVEDALDDDDKKTGIILACQAKPKAEVTVEA